MLLSLQSHSNSLSRSSNRYQLSFSINSSIQCSVRIGEAGSEDQKPSKAAVGTWESFCMTSADCWPGGISFMFIRGPRRVRPLAPPVRPDPHRPRRPAVLLRRAVPRPRRRGTGAFPCAGSSRGRGGGGRAAGVPGDLQRAPRGRGTAPWSSPSPRPLGPGPAPPPSASRSACRSKTPRRWRATTPAAASAGSTPGTATCSCLTRVAWSCRWWSSRRRELAVVDAGEQRLCVVALGYWCQRLALHSTAGRGGTVSLANYIAELPKSYKKIYENYQAN